MQGSHHKKKNVDIKQDLCQIIQNSRMSVHVDSSSVAAVLNWNDIYAQCLSMLQVFTVKYPRNQRTLKHTVVNTENSCVKNIYLTLNKLYATNIIIKFHVNLFSVHTSASYSYDLNILLSSKYLN